MEFTTWSILGTYAGALAMVMLITQLTKGLAFIERLPTQIWSYILALVILIMARAFTDGLSLENAALCLFNAVIVSLGANGGHAALSRISNSKNG